MEAVNGNAHAKTDYFQVEISMVGTHQRQNLTDQDEQTRKPSYLQKPEFVLFRSCGKEKLKALVGPTIYKTFRVCPKWHTNPYST